MRVDWQNRGFIIHFGETDASVVGARAGSERAMGGRVGKKGSGREGWTSKFITGRGRCPPASRYIYFLAERVPRLKSREQKSPWRQRNSILMDLLCFSYRVTRAQPSYSTALPLRARSISNSISPHNYAPFFEFSSLATDPYRRIALSTDFSLDTLSRVKGSKRVRALGFLRVWNRGCRRRTYRGNEDHRRRQRATPTNRHRFLFSSLAGVAEETGRKGKKGVSETA